MFVQGIKGEREIVEMKRHNNIRNKPNRKCPESSIGWWTCMQVCKQLSRVGIIVRQTNQCPKTGPDWLEHYVFDVDGNNRRTRDISSDKSMLINWWDKLGIQRRIGNKQAENEIFHHRFGCLRLHMAMCRHNSGFTHIVLSSRGYFCLSSANLLTKLEILIWQINIDKRNRHLSFEQQINKLVG